MKDTKTIIVLYEDPDYNYQEEVDKNFRCPEPIAPIIQIIESSVDDIYKDYIDNFQNDLWEFRRKYNKMTPKSFQWILKEAKFNIEIYEKMKKIVYTIDFNGSDGMSHTTRHFASFDEGERDEAYNKLEFPGYYRKSESIVDVEYAKKRAKGKLDALDCLLLNI